MAKLSIAEAAKKHSIPRSTINRWVEAGRLSCTSEFRGTREVRLVDDDDILKLRGPQVVYDSIDDDEQAGQEYVPLIRLAFDQIAVRDTRISELQEKIAELSYENGRLVSVVDQVDKRLDEKDLELGRLRDAVAEWKRDLDEARKPKSLWARILGR